jgi:adenylate cyclase
MDALVERHEGRVVGSAGDSVLADFPSAVEALACAVAIQAALHRENAVLPQNRRLEFRIGINLGDILVDNDQIYGDGVNVAARLQAIAPAGGIVVSRGVHDQVKRKLNLTFTDLGAHRVKNIAEPVRVYAVDWKGGRSRRWWRVDRRGRRILIPFAATLGLLAASIGAIWLSGSDVEEGEPSSEAALAPEVEGPPARLQTSDGAPHVPAPDVKPTIAVLPLTDLSGEPEEAYFSDGVTEDIISALGRFSNLLVMSWNAVAPYKGRAATPEELSRDLNVRYVVSGSVRRTSDRVRVTVQLADAERGILLWSDRFDQAVQDVFEVQDAITRGVVASLAVKVTAFESERVSIKPTGSLAAYDYVLRGREHLRGRTREDNFTARDLFKKATEIDPKYAAAYAGLARTHHNDFLFGWTEWPQKTLQAGHDAGRTAVQLDDLNATAHSDLGMIYADLMQHDLAKAELDRALQLNPNDPEILVDRGTVAVWSGRAGEAIPWFEAARRSDPHVDPGWADLGMAYYLARRYDEAIRTLEQGLSRHSDRVYGWVTLAAAYAGANNVDGAQRAAGQVRRQSPFFQIQPFAALPIFDPAARQRFTAHLQKAGLQ